MKNLPAMNKTWIQSLEDPLEKGMAIHSSILARRIPWIEKPVRQQSMGSQRVVHDRATNPHTLSKRMYSSERKVSNAGERGRTFLGQCLEAL